MSEPAETPAHAPRSEGMLFPLGIASLLLGMLFILFWVLLGLGLEGDMPDAEAASVITRRWVLVSLGSFLGLQGIVLLVVRFTRSEALGAGTARTRLLMNVILMVILATVLLGLVNYIFSRHEIWRIDVTSQRLHTLSEESTTLAANLEQSVKVVMLIPRGAGEVDTIERLVTQYQAASPRVTVEAYDPRTMDVRELKLELEELELDPELRESEMIGVVVQSGQLGEGGEWIKNRSKHIALADFWERDVNDPSRRVFLGERLISSAIREVTGSEAVKVFFLAGHGELDIEEFDPRTSISRLVQVLRQRNVDVDELNLLERDKVDVPAECDLLIVAGPKKALTEQEASGLREYLDGGGRALFLLEAWYRRGDNGGSQFSQTGLDPLLLERYGVEPLDEAVFLMFADPRNKQRQTATHQLVCNSLDSSHKITQPLALREARIAFYTARPLQSRPARRVDVKKLVTTASWGERCFSTPDPTRPNQTAALLRYGPFTIGLSAEFEPDPEKPDAGRQASRIAVFGDLEWVTNQFLQEGSFSNQELFLNTFNWLLKREQMMVGEAHRPTSYRLSMTSGALERLMALACPGLPAIAIALGVFAWVIRSRS